jgi:integrase
MNDLSTNTSHQLVLPLSTTNNKRALSVFDSIRSFEDLKRAFLLGEGLSRNTYRNYLQAVKRFYEFTGGLHPLQVRPADIERFYDHISQRVDRATAALHIAGLKKFYAGIRKRVPGYEGPFDTMSEKLKRKLGATKRRTRTRKTLTPDEVKALLSWLREDTSLMGLEHYALVFMLVTSGLRGEELCGLRWTDLECLEGRWTAFFIGKGDRPAEQELYAPAVEACENYFSKAFGREPRGEDALFWTVPAYPGDQPRPMAYPTLWYRIHTLGLRAKREGVIKRDIVISPHLFRRTYATCLYRAGMGIKAIQAKTRHASIGTLVKHYIYEVEDATPYLKRLIL